MREPPEEEPEEGRREEETSRPEHGEREQVGLRRTISLLSNGLVEMEGGASVCVCGGLTLLFGIPSLTCRTSDGA